MIRRVLESINEETGSVEEIEQYLTKRGWRPGPFISSVGTMHVEDPEDERRSIIYRVWRGSVKGLRVVVFEAGAHFWFTPEEILPNEPRVLSSITVGYHPTSQQLQLGTVAVGTGGLAPSLAQKQMYWPSDISSVFDLDKAIKTLRRKVREYREAQP